MASRKKWFERPLDEGVVVFGWLALLVGGGLALSFFVPWIWSEVDNNEGKGAFLGALIGFAGLILVAWLTITHERKLADYKFKKSLLDRVQYLYSSASHAYYEQEAILKSLDDKSGKLTEFTGNYERDYQKINRQYSNEYEWSINKELLFGMEGNIIQVAMILHRSRHNQIYLFDRFDQHMIDSVNRASSNQSEDDVFLYEHDIVELSIEVTESSLRTAKTLAKTIAHYYSNDIVFSPLDEVDSF